MMIYQPLQGSSDMGQFFSQITGKRKCSSPTILLVANQDHRFFIWYKMWAEFSSVLSQFTRLTDGRTDRRTDRLTAHSNTALQRGKIVNYLSTAVIKSGHQYLLAVTMSDSNIKSYCLSKVHYGTSSNVNIVITPHCVRRLHANGTVCQSACQCPIMYRLVYKPNA